MSWTYVISDLNGEEIVVTFYEKELQKNIEKSLDLETQSIEKGIYYMLNRKATIILLITGLIRKIWL